MIGISPRNFQHLEDYIYEFSGIVLHRVPEKGVRERIVQHINSLNIRKFDDYLLLLKSPSGERIRDELMARVTIGESFFFRNPSQFRFLAQEALPAIFSRKKAAGLNQIKIWSAGCSTGEEAYSLAYICDWFHGRNPGVLFEIVGSDINMKNLEKARQGSFRERSFRRHSADFESEFGTPLAIPVPPDRQVELRLQNIVQFKFLNLKDLESLKTRGGSDIIFCRNVLIYFDESFRGHLIHTFHQLLNPGGLLCLGESEMVPPPHEGFELVSCLGAYAYRKVDPTEPGE